LAIVDWLVIDEWRLLIERPAIENQKSTINNESPIKDRKFNNR